MPLKSDPKNAAFIILAAGRGTRMKSELPKVLVTLNEWPMLFFVLEAIRSYQADADVAIVVGFERQKVIDAVHEAVQNEKLFASLKIQFIDQLDQRGTADAARFVIESPWGEAMRQERRPLVVMPGDSPLISVDLVREVCEPIKRGTALKLLSCDQQDPTGYGRVVRRGKSGPVLKIVEHADASASVRAIHEVATSIYLFDSQFLSAGLRLINNRNAQGEFYLTDLVQLAARKGQKIDVLKWNRPSELVGINTPVDLSEATRLLNRKCVRGWAERGVRFVDPDSSYVSFQVDIEPDVVIAPGVQLCGLTKIGRGSTIGAHSILKDMIIGERVEIKPGTIGEKSSIGAGSKVGPYAHLRPGSVVGVDCKIGNFVELKQTTIGKGTSVAHLSYLGDATVGAGVNIGCGFVTCNFDGREIQGSRKHKTIIEDGVFMGSDCQVIAPIRVGRGAYVASGSTLTEDVPADALAIARSRQVNKERLALKLRQAQTDSRIRAPAARTET